MKKIHSWPAILRASQEEKRRRRLGRCMENRSISRVELEKGEDRGKSAGDVRAADEAAAEDDGEVTKSVTSSETVYLAWGMMVVVVLRRWCASSSAAAEQVTGMLISVVSLCTNGDHCSPVRGDRKKRRMRGRGREDVNGLAGDSVAAAHHSQ